MGTTYANLRKQVLGYRTIAATFRLPPLDPFRGGRRAAKPYGRVSAFDVYGHSAVAPERLFLHLLWGRPGKVQCFPLAV